MAEEYASQNEPTTCPQCSAVLAGDARFCSSCGCSTSSAGRPTEIIHTRITNEGQPQPSLVGKVLDSKYELLAILGSGGAGTVYRARRVHIGDEVAVKVLNPDYVLDETAAERFRREARSAAMIRHANIVTIHDFNESKSGTPAYIVMELVRGTSLREILIQENRLSPPRAINLMLGICAGVGVAHRHGLVHRDLKPDNVIVQAPEIDGEPEVAKVVDFGIAKVSHARTDFNLTQTGTMVGTPLYMSPEQWRGQHLDARSDVYSLGAMLYEMLTGTPPFNATSMPELISKQITEEPPAFSPSLNIPPDLQRVCRAALAKQPGERPADAVLFAKELQHALARTAEAKTTGAPFEKTVPVQTAAAPTLPLAKSKPTPGLRWIVASGLALLLLIPIIIGMVFVGRNLLVNRNRNSIDNRDAEQSSNRSSSQNAVENSNSSTVSPITGEIDLAGKWSGTYGPANTAATLTVEEYKDGKFSGVIQQGETRVAFAGTIDVHSRQVTIKETRVLSGSGWSLGEDTGELSADGRSMSGTGSDATGRQFGMNYQWVFSK